MSEDESHIRCLWNIGSTAFAHKASAPVPPRSKSARWDGHEHGAEMPIKHDDELWPTLSRRHRGDGDRLQGHRSSRAHAYRGSHRSRHQPCLERRRCRAYLGASVPEFPNLFMIGGPNTGLSHGGGIFFYIEIRVRYVMQCLREMIEGNKATIEVRQELHDEYNRRIDEMHARMVWAHPDVSNWYKNSKGRVVALGPWRIVDFWKMTLAMNPDDFVFGDATTGDARQLTALVAVG